MKKTVSILLCLLFSLSLSAKPERDSNANAEGTSYESEKTKNLESVESAESIKKAEESKIEPDSSYYSVNKFNFLFYFVYKMKYMDRETEVETPAN